MEKNGLKTEKQCYTCKEVLPTTSFGTNNSKKDKKKHICKECEKVLRRNRYLVDKNRIYKENHRFHKKRKEVFYSYIKEYMKKDYFECTSCGYSHTIHAPFDWHHLDTTKKEYGISSMVRHTKDKLFKELDKCILLCSNCHRILHNEKN